LEVKALEFRARIVLFKHRHSQAPVALRPGLVWLETSSQAADELDYWAVSRPGTFFRRRSHPFSPKDEPKPKKKS